MILTLQLETGLLETLFWVFTAMARRLFAEVGALKGKPDWFWKGVEFAQAFSVIELGAVFTFEKDKLDTGSDAISIAHYIQRSVSVCPLCAQLHVTGAFAEAAEAERRTVRSCSGMCSFKNVRSAHSLERQGSETTENPGWGRRGVSWEALKCKAGKFQGMWLDLKSLEIPIIKR